MIFKHANNATVTTPEARKRLAELLSKTIEIFGKDFEPYKPNADCDKLWCLDSGNNWKLLFLDDQPSHFEIRYRYSENGHPESALAPWIAYKLHIVEVK